jgi:hypothetical protein
MNLGLRTCKGALGRSFFIISILCTPVLLVNACTPVISPQLMEQVDRNLTYGALARELHLWKEPLSPQAYPYGYPFGYPYYRRWWLYPGYPY